MMDEKLIELYHGSNEIVTFPEVFDTGRPHDFGVGFYLSDNFNQAKKWAYRKRKFPTVSGRISEASISVFSFSTESMSQLNIKFFEKANEEWLNYLCANRLDYENSNHDIVIGPLADGKPDYALDEYRSSGNVDRTLAKLRVRYLKRQYCFKTKKAIDFLNFKKGVVFK